MRARRWAIGATALLAGCALRGPSAADAALAAQARQLCERALADSEAIAILQDLLRVAPKRLAGSDGAAAAVQWGLATMRRLGLQHVHAEPCMVPHWVRGEEAAAVLSSTAGDGSALPLHVTALGPSVATPEPGITAEVVEVQSFEQLRRLGDAARGKIVFFNRPMPKAQLRPGQAYGEAVPQRSDGAIEAARAGGVAALVRSVTTAIDDAPHTGMMRYLDDVPKVPAAAIATADAERLAALLRQGPVTLRLRLGCRTLADVESANVVGELPGSEHPERVVVIGGHLDAWELGDGAHDDGAGIAHVLEAARLLQAIGWKPKCTIRVVLFMNEENGLRGAHAYAEAHAGDQLVGALETDSGGFTPLGFTCSLQGAAAARLRQRLLPLHDLDIGVFREAGGAGADIGPLARDGVPLLGLLVDGQRYFDYHHSRHDKLEMVNERELALGAAAVAFAAAVLAEP